MAVVSSVTTANEEKRRRSVRHSKEEPMLPVPSTHSTPKGVVDEEQANAELSYHLKRQFARSHDRKVSGSRYGYEAWQAVNESSSEDEHSPRAYDLALYESDSGLQQVPSGTLQSCKRSIRKLLDRPESSTAASILQTVIMSLIVASTITAVFETVPSLYEAHEDMFKLSEKVFTIIFTVEVVLRAAATENCKKYICTVSNQIDILATSPWYAEKILVATMPGGGHSHHLQKMAGSLRTLRMVRLARMVRLLRVLRIAKFARHSEVLTIVVESLAESITGIWVLVAFVSMWALVSATVVYAVESEQPNTDFESIPAALWWSMSTISTVGYGDMVPETVAGKIVGGASMLGGILITSIAVAVITTTFTEVYQQKCHKMEAMKLERFRTRGLMHEGPNGTPQPRNDSGRHSETDNPLMAWDEMEQDVLKHITRLEAELLDRPLRLRNDASELAVNMLEEQAKNFFKQGKTLMQQIIMADEKSRVMEGEGIESQATESQRHLAV